MEFSVLISVYKNDKADDFRSALESVTIKQTQRPSEVVLVVDGPVGSDLNEVIAFYQQSWDGFKVIRLENNGGLGNALRLGVENTTFDVIARMDSDDISVSNRFEKQLDFLAAHPECDIVGGQISEFIDSQDNIVGARIVPLSNDDIHKYMKHRCALNHMTVMFRKDSVIKAGNYQHWFWNEDYYLWIRMILSGCNFANLPDILVNVRSGVEQYQRRGGLKYFRSEAGIQRLMRRNGFISFPRYCFNVAVRWCIQVGMPKRLRGFVFKKLLRQ